MYYCPPKAVAIKIGCNLDYRAVWSFLLPARTVRIDHMYRVIMSAVMLIAAIIPASSHFLLNSQRIHTSAVHSVSQSATSSHSTKLSLTSCTALCQAVIRRSTVLGKRIRRKRFFLLPLLERSRDVYLRLFNRDQRPRHILYHSASWVPPDLILASGHLQTSR